MAKSRLYTDARLQAQSFARQIFLVPHSGRRLVVIASTLHVLLAVAIFVVARAQIAPNLIDHDGIMGSFAFDSYEYQESATQLAHLLQNGKVLSWATAPQPVHAKLIAVCFAVLGPFLGYGPLSAEPFNLVCYAAIVALTLALGREAGGHRVSLLAGGVVAIFPTFLLHSLQLLKDTLFVTAALAFVFFGITWFTWTYRPKVTAVVATLTVLLVLLLSLVRSNVNLAIFAVALIGLALLIVRQVRERRVLWWNLSLPLLILSLSVLIMGSHSPQAFVRTKQFPAEKSGQSKTSALTRKQVPAIFQRLRSADKPPNTIAGNIRTRMNRLTRRVSSMRSRFAAAYPESGSVLDGSVEFRNPKDLIAYLPRALAIGLWAPFPSMWFSAGRRVNSAGKLLSGAETFLIYLFQLCAVVAVVRDTRRLVLWFLLTISTLGVTALAFVVPNVGALYRFRYAFWILLIIAAMKGLDDVCRAAGLRLRARAAHYRPAKSREISTGFAMTKTRSVRASAIKVMLVCVLLALPACSSPRNHTEATGGGEQDGSPGLPAPTGQAPAAANANMNFSLTNFTGTAFRGVYLSPNTSHGWEENIVAGTELRDGDTLDIRFDPNETTSVWDLRIESADGHFAEWKNLRFEAVADIKLFLKPVPQPVVVAEAE